MEQVLILHVMFAGLTHAFFTSSETACIAAQTSLCSATLGQPVYIHMVMPKAVKLNFMKQIPSAPVKVFSVSNGKVNIHKDFQNRTEFFIGNWTFKIISMEKSDVGQYAAEGFDQMGVNVDTFNVKLDVKAFFTPPETACIAAKTSLCSATLGQPVYIYMVMPKAVKLNFMKQIPSAPVKVFSVTNGKVNIHKDFQNRTEFFTGNWTFKIISMEKSDVGQYAAEGFDQMGVNVDTFNVKLDVQETSLSILVPIVTGVGVVIVILIVTFVSWRCCCYNKKGDRYKKPEESSSKIEL